jgi:uncharacterized iron-regulated protein
MGLALFSAACAMTPGAGVSTADWTPDNGTLVRAAPLLDLYDVVFLSPGDDGEPPEEVSLETAVERLSAYDVILFGESHNHPGIHRMQQAVFRALHGRRQDIALSMEQFERDVQPTVEAYLAGRIGETTLRETGRAWDGYLNAYRPMMEYARAHSLPVVAANAPNWAIVCIGQQGPEVLSRFSAEDRTHVAADLDLRPGRYRDKFLAFQGGSPTHGGGGSPTPEAAVRAERSYAAQVARDETMAESILRIRTGRPGRLVLHLNGSFHSSGFLGVAERLIRRQPDLKLAVIEPVEVPDPKRPTVLGADLALGTLVLALHPTPALFQEGEDQSAWIASMAARRRASTCRYPAP